MKKQGKNKITKEMSFAEIMQKNPEASELLWKEGMSCAGCPLATQESLEQGAAAHGINPEKLLKKLNRKLKGKK